MAYVESHKELRNHPKTVLASTKLNVNKAQVVGHLHFLWWWCMDYAKDGRLDKYTPDQIAAAADWPGNPGEFLQHMADVGFIDRDPLRIHDWQDYRLHLSYTQLRRERKLDQIRRRVKRWRERQAICNATVTQCNAANKTKQNKPEQTISPIPPRGAPSKVLEWFEKTWKQYPKERRVGRKAALRSYQKDVKTLEDAKAVLLALETYLKSDTVKNGFVKNGSTFFANWRDYENDERRNSEGLFSAETERRPDLSSPGSGEQASVADTMLKRLADSKAL